MLNNKKTGGTVEFYLNKIHRSCDVELLIHESTAEIINSLKRFHIYTLPLKVLVLSCDVTPGSRWVSGRAFPVFHRRAVFAGGIRLID